MTIDARVDVLDFVAVHQTDPLAAPLAELAIEYTNRYGGDAERMYSDLIDYPGEEFELAG